MAMATTTYKTEAMIRGYHVHATVWDAHIGEELYRAEKREIFVIHTLFIQFGHSNFVT